MAEQAQTITIDGKEYDTAKLSEDARNHVVNVRVTDQEIERLQRQLAIHQTARTAYARALSSELEAPEKGKKKAAKKPAKAAN